ncbi:MAG: hypothetical protein AB1758_29800 [Candidatus Eremiobacterota bacterium]
MDAMDPVVLALMKPTLALREVARSPRGASRRFSAFPPRILDFEAAEPGPGVRHHCAEDSVWLSQEAARLLERRSPWNT